MISCKMTMSVIHTSKSKHLKGQLGPRVGDVTFFNHGGQLGPPVSDVTFLIKVFQGGFMVFPGFWLVSMVFQGGFMVFPGFCLI